MQRYVALAFFSVLSAGYAQTLIIPQIADGGGWQTTLVFTNTTTTAASVGLSFYEETGGGATQSWNLSFIENVSPQNVSVPGGGSVFLHTPATSSTTSVGWAQLQAPASLVAYAIFTQRVPGRTDQDGTALAASAATRILVPFDNTSSFVTAVGLVNPTASSETISVNFQIDTGMVTSSSLVLPAQGHMAFSLSQQFASTAGVRGTAEFYVSSGSISILALRFNPTGGFTAAPVYAQSGSPIIGGGGGGGGGTLPTFTVLSVSNGTFSPAGLPAYSFGMLLTGSSATGWAVGVTGSVNLGTILSGNIPAAEAYAADWDSASLSGLTFTFGNFQLGSTSIMKDAHGNVSGITSGSLTLTLSPQAGDPGVGTVTGSLTLVSPLATLSGSFSGSYITE
jgi:hypothetical protein